METHLHEGHRERLRMTYQKAGMDGMPDHTVLELLLTYVIPRRDVNELAHRLLNRYGSLSDVFAADPNDLKMLDGIGERTAVYLHMLFDLHRRLNLETAQSVPNSRLENPQDACRYALALAASDRYETLRIICLDATMSVLHTEVLQVGTLSHVSIEPRRVIETALLHRARYVILTHNHPSNILVPSEDDLSTAQMIEQIGQKLEINVKDQLILSKNAAYSYQYDKVFLFSTPSVCHAMTLDEYTRSICAPKSRIKQP